MTENLAARGEGLAAKLSAMAKYWKTNNWANDTLNDGRPSEYTCADELLAALEAAAPLSTPEPFLFAIEEPNGNWQDGESCVFSDLQSAQEEVDLLNDGYDGDGSYKVVPLYREPAGSGANSLHEAAEEILKPHWPSVRNMEENEARQKEVERIIRILRGSPRKVGEDGALSNTCGVIGYPEQGRQVCELLAGHDGYHMQGGVRWLGYHATQPTPESSLRERELAARLDEARWWRAQLFSRSMGDYYKATATQINIEDRRISDLEEQLTRARSSSVPVGKQK